MNSSDNIRRLAVAAAVICTFLAFGAGGAQAALTHVVASSGALAAEETPDSDEDSDTPSPDSSDEDSDSDSEDLSLIHI